MFDVSPEEYKGAIHFCEYLRGKVQAGELMVAWESYHASVMEAWKLKANHNGG